MFTNRERIKYVNMKKEELMNIALENLKITSGIDAKWIGEQNKNIDGRLMVTVDNIQIELNALIIQEPRIHQAQRLIFLANQNTPMIVCAARLYPKMKDVLREQNLAWLEANGNIYLNLQSKLIWIETQKPFVSEKDNSNRAFTKTGLQLVFCFLLNPELITETHRGIAKLTGHSLGNIHNVSYGMKAAGFIVDEDKKTKRLINKKELLDKWLTAYQDVLKPAISLGRFRFVNQENYLDWKNVSLNIPETLWGGEPAAELLTGQLRPAEFTIYTNETKPELMKNYRLLPDEKGDVMVRKKFWGFTDDKINTVSPLLVYADLMLKEEKRCRETAQLIYEEYLDKKF
jgi:hypothetical protein